MELEAFKFIEGHDIRPFPLPGNGFLATSRNSDALANVL